MSIIEKVFKYEETELLIIKYKDEIWFKAVAVATILRYNNTMKSIHDHVDHEDKRNNKKRSHTQLDSRKQVIAFQDRVITINIKEAQHPLK